MNILISTDSPHGKKSTCSEKRGEKIEGIVQKTWKGTGRRGTGLFTKI